MVVASSVGIVPFWESGSERCKLNWLDVTISYQLWEYFGVANVDGIPSGLVFVNLLSVGFAP